MSDTLSYLSQLLINFCTTFGARLLGAIVILIIGYRLMEKTKLALDYSGIKIPYKQLDVHLDSKD